MHQGEDRTPQQYPHVLLMPSMQIIEERFSSFMHEKYFTHFGFEFSPEFLEFPLDIQVSLRI